MSISDEAVEAAARAIRENRTILIPAPEGEHGSSLGYRSPEELAQLALEAAAPYLMAQALEDAAEHLEYGNSIGDWLQDRADNYNESVNVTRNHPISTVIEG